MHCKCIEIIKDMYNGALMRGTTGKNKCLFTTMPQMQSPYIFVLVIDKLTRSVMGSHGAC